MPRSKRLGEAIFFFGRDSAPIITILIPVLLLLGYALITLHSGELDAGWKVDEGQRIAEGYFWRLLVARDFSNQDWFSRIEVRSHPPVNKYFFGAAIAVSGIEPPRSLALVDAYNNGAGAATLPAAFAKEYEPMRRPARLAAHGAMLLIAVIVFAVLLHLYGLVPALLSQVALFRHFLFGQLLFSARSDELEALLTMATVVPLAMLASQKRLWSQLALSGVAGVLAALAFQTRLNGGVALIMCIAFVVASLPRPKVAVARLGLLTLSFAVTAVAINPFYWAAAAPGPSVPSRCLEPLPMPLRIVDRFLLQVSDLQVLLRSVDGTWLMGSFGRVHYVSSIFFSGKAGIILLGGFVTAVAVLLTRKGRPLERTLLSWALVDVVVTSLWLPVRWDSYLLIALAPLVLLGWIGYTVALREIAARLSGGSVVERS